MINRHFPCLSQVFVEELWSHFEQWLKSQYTSFEQIKEQTNVGEITNIIKGSGIVDSIDVALAVTEWMNRRKGN